MSWAFEGFEIDLAGRRLLRDGRELKLEPRALDMLCYLAERPGALVTRRELVREVWRARALSEGVLANAVTKLRKALGQAAGEQAPIETVRGHGYRWRAQMRKAVAPVDGGSPLIGREPTLEVVRAALERLASGGGGFLSFRGEPGSGKTRLLSELARRARQRGFLVWRGAAYEGAGAPPYFPWLEVLRAAERDLGVAALQSHVPEGARALPALLHAGNADPAREAKVDPESARFLLRDELTRFLHGASTVQPIVVLLDDLQWADGACIELLDHAARALFEQPLLFAAAVREDDEIPACRLAALRAVARSAQVMRLRGLSLSESGELVSALQGAPCNDPRALSLLFERTRGNPFFIRQIVQLLLQRGERLTWAALQRAELPPAVRDVVRQRVAELGQEAAAMLSAAATIGAQFDAGLLSTVLDRSLAQTLIALEPALARGLLERGGSSVTRLQFAHGLVREVVYADMPLHERGALHAKVVDALTGADQSDPTQLGALAHHALEAAPLEVARCMTYCRRAADAAREVAGFDVAAELLARLLTRMISEGADPSARCALLLQLGVDQYCAGDIAAAWESLRAGAQLARVLEQGRLLAQFAFRLLDCVEAGTGEEAEARACIEEALRRSGESDPELMAALLAHRAEMAFELPFDARRALLDRADQLAARSEAPTLQLEVACCRANLRDPSQLPHGRAAAARLRALLDAAPAAVARGARAALQRFSAEIADYLCQLTAGDPWTAQAAGQRARELAAESHLVPVRLVGELIGAGQALAEARLGAVEDHIGRMRELGSRVTGGLAQHWLYYALLLADARDGWDALRGLELPGNQLDPSSRYAARALIVFAWRAANLGQSAQARSLLERAAPSHLNRMPVLHGDLGTLCMLAEIYARLSDPTDAARLRSQLAPYSDALAVGPGFEYRGPVSHYLGLLSALLERPAEAAAHFRRARDQSAALGLPLHHARARAECARYRAS